MSEEIKFEYLIGDKQKFKEATDMVVAIIQYGDDDFVWLADIEKAPEVNGNLIGLRRIIKTPVWTVADQQAGRLPDVGAEYNVDGCIVEHLGNGAAGYQNIFYFKYPSGACGNAHERLVKPIETPGEKVARLESEFIDSMIKELKVNIGSVGYQIVRSAIRHSYRKLSGELPPVQAKDGA